MTDTPEQTVGLVHPDLTAFRAVDACGGTYPTAKNDYDSGWRAGHEAAIDAALDAVKASDALTAELLAALQELVVIVNGECPSLLSEDSGGNGRLALEIDAAILRATGAQ